MDNPSLILQAVDARLDHQVRLVVYGRGALCLGFESAPPETARTRDVDVIIPPAQSQELERDSQFWDAIEGANAELAASGLYITHLFPESEIFLRRDWLEHIVPITRLSLRHLRLFRPATIDFVLTKMMRGNDPEDMADAGFMIRHDEVSTAQLLEAFEQMKPITVVELRDAFAKATPIVMGFAEENSPKPAPPPSLPSL